MKREPRVCIVILNWNGIEDTVECIDSLFRMDYHNFDLIIVDNGSTDDSITVISRTFQEAADRNDPERRFDFVSMRADQGGKPIWPSGGPSGPTDEEANYLILVSSDRNLGFSTGVNVGLEIGLDRLSPDFFLLLNNDLVVDSRLIPDLLDMAMKEERAGILGPTVYDYGKDTIQSRGSRVNWSVGKVTCLSTERLSDTDPRRIEADFVGGCCMFVRSSMVRRIGMLRPEYFAYWEEVEWCARAWKAGYEVLVAPQAKVWHKGSVSSNKITGFYIYHNTRNMFWFLRSYLSAWRYRKFLAYFFIARFAPISGNIIVKNRSLKEYRQFLRGIRHGLSRDISRAQYVARRA